MEEHGAKQIEVGELKMENVVFFRFQSKSKPRATWGRKARGLSESAQLPRKGE